MKTAHDIVRNIITTEKGTNMLKFNKHIFKVDKRANKIEIKNAVEEIYKVKVKAVNVLNMPGKKRRVRYRQGMTPEWKKAIVTLSPESKIEVAS